MGLVPMRSFTDASGREWIATAREEVTPRHHGRWYLVLHEPGNAGRALDVRDVHWQSRATAERTLRTISEFELRRRLRIALDRRPGDRPDEPVPRSA